MNRYIEKILQMFERRNLIPKLMSILLAVILWGYLTSTKSGEVKFKVPVTYKNLNESLIVSRISQKSVVVRAKGRKEDLKNINIKNLKINVDLARPQIDEFKNYPIQIVKIDVPEDVLIDYNPEEVKLYIEKKVFKNVKIIPRYNGKPELGLILGRIKPNPEFVKISGPGTILNNIETVNTEYIHLDKRNITFTTQVRLERINLEEIEYSLSDVNVTVPLFAASEIASIELPVIFKNRKKGYRYELKSEKVNISVIIPRSKTIDTLNSVVYIDGAEFPVTSEDFVSADSIEKDAVVKVKIQGIDELSILSIKPEVIKVVILKE